MRTVGIIVEYNPLHNGHEYHFMRSKEAAAADAVVAVMSGNFLQRGEPAIVNKWARAEMALRMGADLIIELPVAYSTQPAEWFAYGAVSALEYSGVVDSFCFGSECGEIDWLHALARRLRREPDSFRRLLRQKLKTGTNYPAAYSAAVQSFAANHNIPVPDAQLSQPNNTLGLHYLISLERLRSSIQPLTITRNKAGYSQEEITDRRIASATAIRRLISEKNSLADIAPFIPAYTHDVLVREWKAGRAPVQWNSFALPLYYRLLSLSAAQLSGLYEVSEGLENRIKQQLPKLKSQPHLSVENLLEQLKTKRYTRTKLQRTLLRILLNHGKDELTAEKLKQGVPYLRILGFSGKGRELLKQMKKTAQVPVLTKAAKETESFLQLDIRAASVYALSYEKPTADEMFRDYFQPPMLLDESKVVRHGLF